MKLKESKLNIQTLQHLVIGFASKLIAQVTKESLNLINILNIQEAKIDDFIKEAQNVSLSSENIPPFLEIKDMDFLFTSLTNAVSAFFSLTAFQKAESITSTITISEAFQGILLLAEISKGSVNQFVYPFPEASKVSINHYQTTLCSNIYFKHNYSFLKPPYLVDLRNSSCLSLSDNYEPSKDFFFVIAGSKKWAKANPRAESCCNLCRKKFDGYFQCSYCLSDICTECTEWMSSKTENSIGLLCARNHVLRMTESGEELYITLNYNNRGTFLCDGCLIKKVGPSVQCRKCKIDFCLDCMDKLKIITNKAIKIKCGRLLKTEIFGQDVPCLDLAKWKFTDVNFKCTNCKKYYNKSGSMNCEQCKAFYCISCSYTMHMKQNS